MSAMKTSVRARIRGVLATLLCGTALLASAGELRSVDVQQGQAMVSNGALLLDVREPHEYAEAHVPGSTLIPLGQLESRLAEIRAHAERPVVVICRSGNRSAQAARLLEARGFSGVHNVNGGMMAWRKAGLPVAAPAR